MPIDTTFDFTQDTAGYWDNWWKEEKGDDLLGTRNVTDPDSQSKTLNDYHKVLWSKKLPCGKDFDLVSKKGRGYYFIWNDGTTERQYSSDSLMNSFRWTSLKPLLAQVKNHVENDLRLDYRNWLEGYVRKLYTIGGMIIFPSRRMGMNQSRGCNKKIADRVDLTFECVRRYYDGIKSPLSNCIEKDADFFSLFNDFRGYVDFFFLQDIVSDDYRHVKCLFGKNDFCDDFFENPTANALPQSVEEYMQWHDSTLEFVEKRNSRIAQWKPNKKIFSYDDMAPIDALSPKEKDIAIELNYRGSTIGLDIFDFAKLKSLYEKGISILEAKI